MEKIVKKVPKMKFVETGEFTNKVEFKAADGKLFKDEKECLDHESHISRDRVAKSIRRMDFNLYIDDFTNWYYISDSDEKNWFKLMAGLTTPHRFTDFYYNAKRVEQDSVPIEIGHWYAYSFEDGGDYGVRKYSVYRLDIFVTDVEIQLALLKNDYMVKTYLKEMLKK